MWEVLSLVNYGQGGAHGLDIYYGMLKLAQKHKISWKEVQETILRVALRKMKVMEYCDHRSEDVIVRRDGSRPHCRRCWTWMDMLAKPSRNGTFAGNFRPLRSKLEEELEETLEFGIGGDQI